MATRFQIYGSSPDALAAQQARYDAMYTGVAENNRSAQTQAVLANIANAERARQEDEQAMARDEGKRNRVLDMLIQLDAQKRGEDYQIGADRENLRRFNVGAGFNERELALREKGDNRQRQFFFEQAMKDAASGAFNDVAEVRSKYAMIPPEEAEAIAFASQTARRERMAENQPLKAAADTLNKQAAFGRYATLADESLKLTPKTIRPDWLPSSLGEAARRSFGPTALYDLRNLIFGKDNPEYEAAKMKKEAADRSKLEITGRADDIRKSSQLMQMLAQDERGSYSAPALPWESNAPARAITPVAPVGIPAYNTEADALAAGHRPGDVVRLIGIGKVRLE